MNQISNHYLIMTFSFYRFSFFSLVFSFVFSFVFSSVLFTERSEAAILVFPSGSAESDLKNQADLESYFSTCRKEGYICIDQFIERAIAQQPLKKYDQLIEELDLMNSEFREGLSQKIKKILETEPISLEQAQALKSIARRSVDIDPKQKELKSLSQDINALIEEIERIEVPVAQLPLADSSRTAIFILQKKVRGLPRELLKTLSFHPYIIETSPTGLIENGKKTTYSTGSCDQPQLTAEMQKWVGTEKFVFHVDESCKSNSGLTQIFSSSSASNNVFDPHQKTEDSFLKRNSTGLMWASFIAGALLFSQNYELTVE